MAEKAYDFRQKLLTVHEKDVRDFSYTPTGNMLQIKDGAVIEIGNTDDIVINTAAEDFIDFLSVSMHVKASVSKDGNPSGDGVIRLMLARDENVDLKEADGYKGFLIEVTEGINIYGYDNRGVAAALYYLEDLMCFEKAPYIKKGEIYKKPMMSPLMVHSGYGMEEWPDDYLMRIAHEGRDALLVFVEGPNKTRVGYLDFNELIERAARFGLDVYAYSFMPGGMHPDDEGAEEFYDNIYGELFRKFPGFKGVTMVGEVVEFNSKDPHVGKRSWDGDPNDIPEPKFWPGWWPCEDLPKWVNLVKKVIRRVKPDADIVLWSYNWSRRPEEARIKLIENMPSDITWEATWESADNKKVGDAMTEVSDYTLSFVGPSSYFTGEAKAAKKNGMKVYSMTQAAGVTWDFGLVPFEPMLYQWLKRYENMRMAIHDLGLCGSMDCHHHGFYPSIITKFSKHAFLTPEEPLDDILDRIMASEYGRENLEKLRKGFEKWSEAITYYTPSEGDLCCASRVGPAYPFCLYHKVVPPHQEEAMFGNRVVSPDYHGNRGHYTHLSITPFDSFLSVRIHPEIESLQTMPCLMCEGTAIRESIENKNEKLLSIINIGKYITNCVQTNINAKKWHILKCKSNAMFEREGLLQIVEDMELLLNEEIKNAQETIPLVERDSRLGWEPSMLYLGDKEHLEWKIRQVNFVLEHELPFMRRWINV